MDATKARNLAEELKEKSIHSYQIIELINHGKSAAVFKAKDSDGNFVALKIFDNDLVEHFGHEIQVLRIQKEIALKNHGISNLVKIIEGGKEHISGHEYYFIVMEYIEGENLKEYLRSNEVDNNFLKSIVRTLFDVSETLLSKGVVHRDIKTENIMISPGKQITLMDLGVLKLVGVKSFSDTEEKQFVGTRRYAPPEFLTRHEEDNEDGWRAVNYYQIGGVMHDIISGRELFVDKVPYPNLVIAIKEDYPTISVGKFPFRSVQLTRDLLTKDPVQRLGICTSQRISKFFENETESLFTIEAELEKISAVTSEHRIKFESIESIKRSNEEKNKRRVDISQKLMGLIRNTFDKIVSLGIVNRIGGSSQVFFETDKRLYPSNLVYNTLFAVDTDIAKGLLPGFHILIRIVNDDTGMVNISFLCLFSDPLKVSPLYNADEFFRGLLKRNIGTSVNAEGKNVLKMFDAFTGNIEFDEQTQNMVTIQLIRLIGAAINGVKEDVALILEEQEKTVTGQLRTADAPRLYEIRLFSKTDS